MGYPVLWANFVAPLPHSVQHSETVWTLYPPLLLLVSFVWLFLSLFFIINSSETCWDVTKSPTLTNLRPWKCCTSNFHMSHFFSQIESINDRILVWILVCNAYQYVVHYFDKSFITSFTQQWQYAPLYKAYLNHNQPKY